MVLMSRGSFSGLNCGIIDLIDFREIFSLLVRANRIFLSSTGTPSSVAKYGKLQREGFQKNNSFNVLLPYKNNGQVNFLLYQYYFIHYYL